MFNIQENKLNHICEVSDLPPYVQSKSGAGRGHFKGETSGVIHVQFAAQKPVLCYAVVYCKLVFVVILFVFIILTINTLLCKYFERLMHCLL